MSYCALLVSEPLSLDFSFLTRTPAMLDTGHTRSSATSPWSDGFCFSVWGRGRQWGGGSLIAGQGVNSQSHLGCSCLSSWIPCKWPKAVGAVSSDSVTQRWTGGPMHPRDQGQRLIGGWAGTFLVSFGSWLIPELDFSGSPFSSTVVLTSSQQIPSPLCKLDKVSFSSLQARTWSSSNINKLIYYPNVTRRSQGEAEPRDN